jgi:hypothetical protein
MDVMRANFTVVRSVAQSLLRGGAALRTIPTGVKTLIERDAWRHFTTEAGHEVRHDRFEDFVTTAPLEGLGATVEQLERLCADDVEASHALRSALKRQAGRGSKSTNNISRNTIQGTARAYTLDRLSREAPDLYEEVKAKNLSANAAAIKAGFRKPSITVPLDPEALARVVRRRFTAEEIQRLVRALVDA